MHKLTVDAEENEAGVLPLSVRKGKLMSNQVPFAVDTLPECLEQEPNNEPDEAQQVTLPIIINGRIDPPGDWDVFRFDGHAGQEIVARGRRPQTGLAAGFRAQADRRRRPAIGL